MNILNKFNTLKFKMKLNNAIMESVAKAIGEEAEKEIKTRIELIKASYTKIAQASQNNLAIDTSSANIQDADTLLLGNRKRDFDQVMDLMEEIKKLEKDERFNVTMTAVKNVFEQCLNDTFLLQKFSELHVTSEFEKFKSVFFFALYFIFYEVLSESKEKKDNEIIFGYKALDLYVMSVYPTFGEWLERAKKKYQSSDIYTNTCSRQLLKYLYDVLQYENELKEENIIENLIQFRAEIIEKMLSNIELLPENAIIHPMLNKEKEKEEKERISKILENNGIYINSGYISSNVEKKSEKSKYNISFGIVFAVLTCIFLIMAVLSS